MSGSVVMPTENVSVPAQTQEDLRNYWMQFGPNAGQIVLAVVWDDGNTTWDDGATIWTS